MIDQFLNPYIIDFGSCAPVYRETRFKVREERCKYWSIQYSPLLSFIYTIMNFLRSFLTLGRNLPENSITGILFSMSIASEEYFPSFFSTP